MKQRIVLIQLVLVCSSLGFAHAQSQDISRFAVAGLEDKEVEVFFLSFKDAVGKGDRKKVASLVQFPVRVTLSSGRRMRIKTATEFLRNYNQIFGAELKKLIAETEVKDLWAKSAGVATPRGEVWISGIVPNGQENYIIRIIAINGVFRSEE